ncbi:MAG: UDP-N-acetylmuramoyl-L-alanine--D-glutamate ligase [Pseudomonadota bacterium]
MTIDVFPFAGYPVAVMGLGKSGRVAARALMRSGAEVSAWDDAPAARDAAAAEDIPLVDLSKWSTDEWREATTLVLSPGLPHRFPKPHPVAAAAQAAGVEIICDIELLGRTQRDASFVGITGTNGKSTTTALVGHILEMAGRDVAVGGNLGPPALSLDALGESGTYVLEMSSYQLERTVSITFDAAALLNISPDHLDRHGGMDGYIAAKRQIFHRQTKPRAAVIGVDDPHCAAIHDALKAKGDQIVIPISAETKRHGGVYAPDGVLFDDMDGREVRAVDLRMIETLQGRHNWQNACAAYALCRVMGVQEPVIVQCLRNFPGLAHRQEVVGSIDGVRFVNDSKATNADAATRALAAFAPIYWIAGGRAKAGGLDALGPELIGVRRAFLIGECAEDFAAQLKGKVETKICGDLQSATVAAFTAASADDMFGATVLLSPAAASFDQFENFEARGDAFRAIAEGLGAD